jgi:hypothetical protein
VSLGTRAADEAGELCYALALWVLLGAAFAPVNLVVSALPYPVEQRFWHAAVPAAVAVAVIRYYDPSWKLLRGFVVGAAATAMFTSLSVLSGLSLATGGTWGEFVAVTALWVLGIGVGVALAHPATWRRLRRRIDAA